MAKRLQLRRGTTAHHGTFTGAVGEVTIDTDKDVVVVHDGTTAGGFPLAKQTSVDSKVAKVTSTDNAVVRFNGTTGEVQNSSVIIDDSGNVGIGTSSPAVNLGKALHIYNNINDGTANSNASLKVESANRNSALLLYGNTNTINMFTSAGVSAGGIAMDSNLGTTLLFGSKGFGYGVSSGGTVTQLTSKSTVVTLNKPCGRIIMNNAALAAGAVISFIFYNSLITMSDTVVINTQADTYNALNSYDVKVEAMGHGYCYIIVKNNTASALSDAIGLEFTVIKGATA